MKNVMVLVMMAFSLGLAACASGPKGVRVTNGGTSAFTDKQGEKIRNLSDSDISARIVGKTFQYTRKDGNGFVTYNADGSLEYQDDTKGAGKGRWTVAGEQYCEAYGTGPQECGAFKTTGDAFFAANSRLVEMQV